MNIDSITLLGVWSTATFAVHSLGVVNAAHAVMNVRSSRGAIAWSLSLVTFPWLAIPLYWVFGRNRFQGYDQAMRKVYGKNRELIQEGYDEISRYKLPPDGALAELQSLADELATVPFTCGNAVDLLVDGDETFAAMLAGISSAKRYILLQSYIVNDDRIGNRFREALIERARAGVQVSLLYDEVGSNRLGRSYIASLREHNIRVSAFHSTKGWRNRLQFNFRNHRKILVVDGKVAFIGGLNIGDEYRGLDKSPRLRPWRDTHLRVEGPAVQCMQYCFLQDWYWATAEVPAEINFVISPNRETNASVFIFPTGPADRQQACILFFTNLINQASHRLWIASPYFVPDESVLTALKLAAMRGVDVRILLPSHADHLNVYLCSYSFYPDLQSAGIKLCRYKHGFMHQKVLLIDDECAGVGTVNFDNRSFLLNFEITSFIVHRRFAERVEKMFLADFDASYPIDLGEYERKPFWFKLVVKVTRLLAPVL